MKSSAVAVTVLALVLATRPLADIVYRSMSTELDLKVGDVDPPLRLGSQEGKHALVIGGTRGIGRGIAVELARLTASVTVVGRSGGEGAIGKMMDAHAGAGRSPRIPRLMRIHADLQSAKGCDELVAEIERSGIIYDYVVLTVGMWPDRHEPQNAHGLDRAFMLDVYARFHIVDALASRRLVRNNVKVLSVLAPTRLDLPTPPVASIRSFALGERTARYAGLADLPRVLGSITACHDALIQTLPAKHPKLSMRAIGFHPGLVPTEVMRPSFPRWLGPLIKYLLHLVPFASSEASAGLAATQVLLSFNAQKRPTTYFNHMLEGRRAIELAYDAGFQAWLWGFLEGERDRISVRPSHDR